MKKRLWRAMIAFSLIFALTAGMLASADYTSTIWDGRGIVSGEGTVTNTATYNLYVNAAGPNDASGATKTYSGTAKLRQTGSKLTKLVMQKDTASNSDIRNHWF